MAVNQYGDRQILLSDSDHPKGVTGIIVEKAAKEKDNRENPTWSCGSLYILLLLMWAELLVQMDRFLTMACFQPMAQELQFGSTGCSRNYSFVWKLANEIHCDKIEDEATCTNLTSSSGQQPCAWAYTGQGMPLEFLFGPTYTAFYSLIGIALAFAVDSQKRKPFLVVSVLMMSLVTAVTGLVTAYWQLVLLRLSLAASQAVVTPTAVSLIGDLFMDAYRGAALGLYSLGALLGFSGAYVLAEYITRANIIDMGWRWAFYVTSFPGLVLGILFLLSMREPEKRVRPGEKANPQAVCLERGGTRWGMMGVMLGAMFKPCLLILSLGAAIRKAAGNVWWENAQQYYEDFGVPPEQLNRYMVWLPLAGSAVGVVFGGILSDKMSMRIGPRGRILIIAIGLLMAGPFAAGSLLVAPPYSYFVLLPCYTLGEVWFGVTLAVVIDVTATPLRTTCVAFYLFLVASLGGVAPLLASAVHEKLLDVEFRGADAFRLTLLILFAGGYILSALVYLTALCTIKVDVIKTEKSEVYAPMLGETDPGGGKPKTRE